MVLMQLEGRAWSRAAFQVSWVLATRWGGPERKEGPGKEGAWLSKATQTGSGQGLGFSVLVVTQRHECIHHHALLLTHASTRVLCAAMVG